MPLNKWGAFICNPCWKNDHRGASHMGLCQCTCDGRHDSKGKLIKK